MPLSFNTSHTIKIMRIFHLSLWLGLTTTFVTFPVAVKAFDYDYSGVENISTRPIESDYVLDFLGDDSNNQGFGVYWDPNNTIFEISKNSPNNPIPYYATGRSLIPSEPPSTAINSASLTSISAGFPNLASYLTDNDIPLDSIGFKFGQINPSDFTETWNFQVTGDMPDNINWFASSDSTIEERIYSASPDKVEMYLTQGTTKIINLGYSPFYTILDYGPTTSTTDDFDAILTDPLSVEKAAGLDPLLDGLADSFLEDVATVGDSVQFVFEEFAVEDPDVFFAGNGFFGSVLELPFNLRAVDSSNTTVPEPSLIIGSLMVGSCILRIRKKGNITEYED